MLALLIAPLVALVVQQESFGGAGTRGGLVPDQVRLAQRPRARAVVAAVAPARERLQLERAPPPPAPPRGGGGGGGGGDDDWASHRIRKMETDRAQAVLADWAQRARIYRMGPSEELRAAQSAALQEMEQLEEFSRQAGALPRRGMETLRGLRMVLGLFDPEEAVTGLAAAEVSSIRGVVITGFLVNPAELNDGASSTYLRLKAGLQLFAQANNLALDMAPVRESIAIVRGTNDQVIVAGTEYGATFSAPPDLEEKMANATRDKGDEEEDQEEAAELSRADEEEAAEGAAEVDPVAGSFRDLDALTHESDEAPRAARGWTRGTSLAGDLLAAIAQEDYASAARLRDLMALLDSLDTSGALEDAAADLDAAIQREDPDTAAALREKLDLAADELRAALDPGGGL